MFMKYSNSVTVRKSSSYDKVVPTFPLVHWLPPQQPGFRIPPLHIFPSQLAQVLHSPSPGVAQENTVITYANKFPYITLLTATDQYFSI